MALSLTLGGCNYNLSNNSCNETSLTRLGSSVSNFNKTYELYLNPKICLTPLFFCKLTCFGPIFFGTQNYFLAPKKSRSNFGSTKSEYTKFRFKNCWFKKNLGPKTSFVQKQILAKKKLRSKNFGLANKV